MAAIIVNMECITNMHVGNGDVNFNIVDNEVERDVVTGYPTINASGIKGALREYFAKKEIANVDDIFGKDSAGKLKFLNADMLALAMRASEGNAAYYLITTDEAIQTYKEKFQLFLNQEIATEKKAVEGSCAAEGICLNNTVIIGGKDLHIVNHKDFALVSLPVVARNKLDNGKSENLWYEEVVPHKSIFSFVVLAESADQTLLNQFVDAVDGQIVQFGGNSTIGYGLCKLSVTKEA